MTHRRPPEQRNLGKQADWISLFLGSIILALVLILSMAGLFLIKKETLGPLMFQGILELLIPAVICRAVKARKLWLKYVLIIELLIVLTE